MVRPGIHVAWPARRMPLHESSRVATASHVGLEGASKASALVPLDDPGRCDEVKIREKARMPRGVRGVQYTSAFRRNGPTSYDPPKTGASGRALSRWDSRDRVFLWTETSDNPIMVASALDLVAVPPFEA